MVLPLLLTQFILHENRTHHRGQQFIGLETAKQLAELGYLVYIGSRDQQRGLAAVEALHALGLSNVDSVQLDVTNLTSIQQARQKLEARLDALDTLINNAGIAGYQPQTFATSEMTNLRALFETNFFGAVQTTQQFMPLLAKAAHPVIVNVSSEVGSLTLQSSAAGRANWDLFSAYGSSKTALNAFTLMLASELKDTGFRVNSVTPGYTATNLNGHQGLKTVAEGAQPIVRVATQGDELISGKFYQDQGEIAW